MKPIYHSDDCPDCHYGASPDGVCPTCEVIGYALTNFGTVEISRHGETLDGGYRPEPVAVVTAGRKWSAREVRALRAHVDLPDDVTVTVTGGEFVRSLNPAGIAQLVAQAL